MTQSIFPPRAHLPGLDKAHCKGFRMFLVLSLFGLLEGRYTKFQKYTANVKLDSAHRYVEIDMIFETARFELVFGSSASQDDHFSPLRHPKGINRRRIAEALEEGNDERQHPQGGRHHIQFTTTQTASPSMTPPGAADNHI